MVTLAKSNKHTQQNLSEMVGGGGGGGGSGDTGQNNIRT